MNFRSLVYILAAIFPGFLVPYIILLVLGLEIKNPEQHLVNAIWRGSVYSLFSLGYALVFSIMGLLNLAHSTVFMWGAFAGLMAVTELDLPLWTALPAGMLGGGLVSIAVDVFAFLPLRRRNAPRTAQLISSIGAAVILVNLASITFGTSPQRFPQESIDALPIDASEPLEVAFAGRSFIVTPLQIGVLIISLLLMLYLQYLVASTRTGRAMRVVAFNQRIATLLGINVGQIFSLTFFLAGALAGAAGVLYGLAFNSMTPFMGEAISLTGLTVIILGGLGSIRGTMVGGFLIANIEVISIAAGYSWLADAMVFTALFLMLLIRPQGLLGEQKFDKI
ncbi:MAG TPA: branched-chain amino acid ABC transporter permease [Aggregatilineales bacterium]|nr:branched-chain amino acid ABC transporter permease [Aggregatilineales bacterium]